MSRHDRLLHILTLLRRRGPISMVRLAEECGVTQRTIYRDIDTIARANYPIYYDRGYRLLPTATLPPPQFTSEEQALLRSALDSWPLASTPAYRTSLRRIRAKLESWMPSNEKNSQSLPGPLIRPRAGTDRAADPKMFATITKAIAAERCLDVRYDAIASGATRRRIEPYFLVFRGRAYYLVAFCRKRLAFRLFRLGRFRSLSLTRETYERDPSVDLERLFRGSWDVYLGTPFEATVRFRGRAARVVAGTKRHASEAVRKEESGELLYTVSVNSIEEFGRWILGFGGEAQVVSPGGLAEWVTRQARDILIAYREARPQGRVKARSAPGN